MYELMTMDYDVELRIISDGDFPGFKSFYNARGGGHTENSGLILLSDKLGSTSWDYPEKAQWSLGAVAMHELLYHIHPLGSIEQDPTDMRGYYNLKLGTSKHDWGPNQTPGIKIP